MLAIILEIGNKKFLFDSGPGTIRQLLKLKIDLLDIGNIFYTHLHNDHINDLRAIIWSNNYGNFRKRALNLFGPKGFKKYYKVLMKKILKPTKLIYKINIKEMWQNSIINIPLNQNSNNKFSLKNKIIIKSIKSKHTNSSISYRIEYKNKVIVYSGDTDYSSEIIEISKMLIY